MGSESSFEVIYELGSGSCLLAVVTGLSTSLKSSFWLKPISSAGIPGRASSVSKSVCPNSDSMDLADVGLGYPTASSSSDRDDIWDAELVSDCWSSSYSMNLSKSRL